MIDIHQLVTPKRWDDRTAKTMKTQNEAGEKQEEHSDEAGRGGVEIGGGGS